MRDYVPLVYIKKSSVEESSVAIREVFLEGLKDPKHYKNRDFVRALVSNFGEKPRKLREIMTHFRGNLYYQIFDLMYEYADKTLGMPELRFLGKNQVSQVFPWYPDNYAEDQMNAFIRSGDVRLKIFKNYMNEPVVDDANVKVSTHFMLWLLKEGPWKFVKIKVNDPENGDVIWRVNDYHFLINQASNPIHYNNIEFVELLKGFLKKVNEGKWLKDLLEGINKLDSVIKDKPEVHSLIELLESKLHKK